MLFHLLFESVHCNVIPNVIIPLQPERRGMPCVRSEEPYNTPSLLATYVPTFSTLQKFTISGWFYPVGADPAQYYLLLSLMEREVNTNRYRLATLNYHNDPTFDKFFLLETDLSASGSTCHHDTWLGVNSNGDFVKFF